MTGDVDIGESPARERGSQAFLGQRIVEEGVTPTTTRIGLLKYGIGRTKSPAPLYNKLALIVPCRQQSRQASRFTATGAPGSTR